MKTINLIIGERSNISLTLKKKLKNSYLVSSNDILKNNNNSKIYKNDKKYNLIINSFYPSFKLKKDLNLDLFINKSILILSKLLETFRNKKINKIIYTSSSSVYNLSRIDISNRNIMNKEIYSLTKYLCERILAKYTQKHRIKLIIARLFNVYGGRDNFSIIKNITEAYLKKKNFTLYNNGQSIRDFIHVEEVCEKYEALLRNKSHGIYDIGKGYGYKVYDLISLFKNKKLILNHKNIKEQDISIANNKYKFKKNYDLKRYIISKTKIQNSKKLKKYFLEIENKFRSPEVKGSIIYGAGNAGKQVCDLILDKNSNGVYCFVDDDKKKIGKKYKNKHIISREDLKIIANKKKVPNIIVAIPSIKSNNLKKLFKELYKISLSVNNLPLKSELNTDKINLSDIQNSEFLHIFEKKNNEILQNFYSKLKNKKILVTGAGGSIGSELVYQLSRIVNKKIICLDFSELFLFNLKNNIGLNQKKIKLVLGDINDEHLLKKIINNNQIDIIFHAAAYKHLNFLEDNGYQAIKNNILGTYNLINVTNKITKKRVKIINISTDKAVKPSSNLGISKRIGEILCQSHKDLNKSKVKISTVRFGNVFGSTGSAINLFLEKINNGENINLTHKNVKRFFMSINEACNLVIAASQLKDNFKIYILDMGKPIKINDLLKKIIKIKTDINKNFKIKIKETGLSKGEKLVEELSINKKIKKTNVERILEVKEPVYPLKDVKKIIENIKKNLSHKNLISDLKFFLRNEN